MAVFIPMIVIYIVVIYLLLKTIENILGVILWFQKRRIKKEEAIFNKLNNKKKE